MNRKRMIAGLSGLIVGITASFGGAFLCSPLSPYYNQERATIERELNGHYSSDFNNNQSEERFELLKARYEILDAEYKPFFYRCAGVSIPGSLLAIGSLFLTANAIVNNNKYRGQNGQN